ncbi:MAG: HAD family phosphatase [Erysipelotrichaceae bacterium]|nr:HAD family phosphatase [Erysipelotrichaceae bacterium]
MNYKEEIKAVAFDFDGTLIDFKYNATELTKTALKKLCDSHYKVCVVSGRPCFLALKAFEDKFGDLPLDYVFGCNGSEVMDVRKGEIKILTPLKAEDVRHIASLINAPYLIRGIYDGETFLVDKMPEDQEFIDWMNARWLTPVLYDYAKNDKVRSKVICLNKKEDRDREDAYLKGVDLSNYNAFYSSPNCFEIAPKGVSKASSCEYLAKELGCSMKQILTFGDNDNDMDMLKATSGVIMDNAREELKAQIPLHTGRVDEGGIYEFLSQNGLI